ncbi:MAG: histidine phosphatase family protein [Actinomycetota bacterium]
MTLRLVRHGETEWSAQGRYTGHTDLDLTTAGMVQAEALRPLAGEDYDSIWCSDLRRCTETARLMGVEATATPRLREFDFGAIDGKRWDDLDATTQQGLLDFDGFVAPGGESVSAFGDRLDDFVGALPPGRHLLIVHGGVIRHLLRRVGTDDGVAPGSWRDLRLVQPKS